MASSPGREARLAILIDADNSNPARLPQLLAEIAKFGNASVRRAYGNWTSGHLGGWKNGLLTHSIQPIQQFNYTTGKNATDSALIIDAMDLLYGGHLDGFCIVSSDSDFTRLAARIREQGLTVYGFGERKTPQAFVAACDKFVYTENLGVEHEEDEDESGGKPGKKPARKPAQLKRDRKLDALLREAVEAASDDSGWAPLGAVGSNLVRLASDFDPRSYGFRKLKDLAAAHPAYVVEERTSADGKSSRIYLRAKK
ncbi:NYN domain-containing protein [Cognatiluteimonas weifangensis]|uniref:NYN domain-containing protein n=1 Tax=Cognatiluteimonas weifangensis TaxID=2303539 RepID=A0A372DNL2_9GAMM|nr:NYN domain-containing protein [Luteimonas weifangensis]RFP61064.1 NYN domain-containing protein [Luteimonas weifangensis]